MEVLSLALFFIYSYCLGFTVTSFVTNPKDVFEKTAMRVGVGMGTFAILGIVLHLLHLPIDWKIFLSVSVVYPVIWLVRNHGRIQMRLKLTKSFPYSLAAIGLAVVLLIVMLKGSFAYPWLEDDDPWFHAKGMLYVSTEKTLSEPDGKSYFQYIDPYPPAYDMMMGVLYQTGQRLNWTLKFFNSLFIALGLLFFYFFAKHFTGHKRKALFSTFVLFAIPSFLSHFIWAHSLVIALLFVALYCFEQIRHDKKWAYVGGIVIAGIFVVQPTQPLKFMVLWGVYITVKSIAHKKVQLHTIGSVVMGGVLSLTWWGTRIISMLKVQEYALVHSGTTTASNSFLGLLTKPFPPTSGSATRAYKFSEIIGASSQNMINNPIGIGLVLSVIIALGVLYVVLNYRKLLKEENSWMLIALLWAVFAFIGFNSVTFNLPVGFYGFRFWMLFAVAGSLLAPLGLLMLYKVGRSAGIPTVIILITVITGVFFTSFIPKYGVNTSIWSSSGYNPFEGLSGQGYAWIMTLPPGTKVFDLGSFGVRVIGFDMYSCEWCPEVKELRKRLVNMTPMELHSEVKQLGYQYIIADQVFFQEIGAEAVQPYIEALVSSQLFVPVHSTQTTIVMSVS